MATEHTTICKEIEQEPKLELFMQWHVLHDSGQHEKADEVERQILEWHAEKLARRKDE